MELQDLRAQVTDFLSYDLDNFKGESPTNAQLNVQINHALRIISRELHLFDPKVTFTLVADQFRYNLDDTSTPVVSKPVVRPFYVTINGNKLWNSTRDDYGMWGFQEFIGDHPSWETSSSGTPTKAVLYGSRELLLHQAPTSAVVSAGDNFIAGQVLATALSGDTDDPSNSGVPVEIHEAIAYLAAVHASKPMASTKEMWQRIGAYNKDWREMVKVIRNENLRLFHSGNRRHQLYSDYIEL